MILGAINNLGSQLTSLLPGSQKQEGTSADFAALLAEKQESGQLTEQQVESAQELLRALGNQATIKPGGGVKPVGSDGHSVDEPLKLTDLREQNQELVASFQQRLKNLLLEQGLSPQINFEIATDLAGRPVVDSPLPNHSQITELIQSDPNLMNLFNQISANQSLLDAAEEHSDFATVYESDPEQAVELFAHLFQPKGFSDFRLKYDGQV